MIISVKMNTNLQLDPSILKRIEENRQKALEIRKRKLQERNSPQKRAVVEPTLNKFSSPSNCVPSASNLNKNDTTKLIPCSPNKNDTNKLIQSSPNKNDTTKLFSCSPNKNDEIKWVPYSPKKSVYTQIKDHPQTTVKNAIKSSEDSKPLIKMSIKLSTSTRFEIKFDYEANIIQLFRNIPSKKWDPFSKTWSFSIEHFGEIMKFLQINNGKMFNIKFEDSIPEPVINHLIKSQELKKKKIDLSERFDKKFLDTLYPFQREGIIFGIQREGKCLIADDMGLGKSLQAIGLAKWYRSDWPLLIVCPSSLKFQWKGFILKWIPDVTENDIFVAKNTKEIFLKVNVTIASYDLLARMRNRLTIPTNNFYKMIIMDESHYIKSDSSQRTNTVTMVAESCKRIILLSGTPALSRPIELFPQINVIAEDIFPSKHGFGVRYCDAKQKTLFRYGKPVVVWDYRGAKNLQELKIILENTIMIRRLKKDVLNELPAKKREMICLSTDYLTEKKKKELNTLKNLIKSKKADQQAMVPMLFAKSAEAKIEAVNEFLSDYLQRETKLICFCHHKSMMDGIEEMLNKNRVNHIRIDGQTDSKDRQKACEVFQAKENFKVALLSITACATGLNLTSASVVIFAEAFWNPGVLSQAEDRVHRIGQSENVRVIYLMARGTIDELMWPLLSRKLDILNKAGLSRDTFSDTQNPLDLNSDQRLITEFINSLDMAELESPIVIE